MKPTNASDDRSVPQTIPSQTPPVGAQGRPERSPSTYGKTVCWTATISLTRLLVGAVILLTWTFGPAPAQAQTNNIEAIEAADEDCIDCHTDLEDDEREFTFPDGAVLSFDLDLEPLRASVHGQILSCVSCHEGYGDDHAGFPRESMRLKAKNSAAMCVRCHESLGAAHTTQDGTPFCTDCHSAHQDPSIAKMSPLLSRRCGACHDQALADFEAGGHAAALALDSPNADLPACITCHPQHPDAEASLGNKRLEATALCIDCHSRDLLIRKYELPKAASKSYTNDFHGATFQFLWKHPADESQPNVPDVMICSDCHGSHDVKWRDRGELAAVCLDCHKDADEKLVGAWLGHDPVGPTNGSAVWAVRMLYFVFIPLVLGGLLLNILLHLRHERRSHAMKAKSGAKETHAEPAGLAAGTQITRFSILERLEHLAAMSTFLLLVLTGIPQSYPQSAFGNWFIELWGGIGTTRVLHRIIGCAFVALFVFHVGRGALGTMIKKRIPAMFLQRQDFVVAWRTLWYYLGRGVRPKVGKFDFREKFEYWGLFLGSILMAVTGFILMFPGVVSQILPGALLAAARTMHGLEATFAVLVVVIWHFYGVIFRPEVFPLDTAIFTGKISLERLRDEHELEYERLRDSAPPASVSPKPDPT